MYALLPRPPSPGLPCFAVRVTGQPTAADAERLCQALGHLRERQRIRLLLCVEEGTVDAWEPLREALARCVHVERVAFVGAAVEAEAALGSRCFEANEEGAAWSWVRGLVPPAPSWETPPTRPVAPPKPREAGFQGDGAVRLPALAVPPARALRWAATTTERDDVLAAWHTSATDVPILLLSQQDARRSRPARPQPSAALPPPPGHVG